MAETIPETQTFQLNKLVRDRIVALTEAEGGVVDYEILSGEKLIAALISKFKEELKELEEKFALGQDLSEELFDLSEIAKSINQLRGISAIQNEVGRARKESRAGSFVAGHFVHAVTLPEDNEWAVKFAANPKKFPQITPKIING